MGSREDDDYWNTKYAEASCYEHGEGDHMWYDGLEWQCDNCGYVDYDDVQAANEEAYNYG